MHAVALASTKVVTQTSIDQSTSALQRDAPCDSRVSYQGHAQARAKATCGHALTCAAACAVHCLVRLHPCNLLLVSLCSLCILCVRALLVTSSGFSQERGSLDISSTIEYQALITKTSCSCNATCLDRSLLTARAVDLPAVCLTGWPKDGRQGGWPYAPAARSEE